MQTIKCKYCGGTITLSDENHGYCNYCSQEVTFPSKRDERTISMYERANHFRSQGEFDRAYRSYQHLLEDNDQDAELHWNLFLCRYGVEYVEDKRRSNEELGIREFKPTISRMSFESMLEDPDYVVAIQYADETGRRIYRTEGAKLARIQTQYQEIARNETPYDVFISFKAEENNVRTKASEMGQEIYEQLTAKGLKVFFSRITLEDKLTEAYEPYIYAALKSSRIMLLVADKKEQLNARWVKNEWSRFLAMQQEDRNKYVIPVYNSELENPMSPYDFPDAIPTAQAQDMGKIGAMQDLVRGVLKMTGHAENEQVYVMEGGVTVEKLLRRAGHALADKAFDEVLELVEQVLDVDAENGQAYLYKLLAENQASTMSDLMEISLSWKHNKDYGRAQRYGGEREKAEIALFEEDCKKEEIYRRAKSLAENGYYKGAIADLEEIRGYRDVAQLVVQFTGEKEQKELLAQYKAEIGDPRYYLNSKFQQTYPSEAAKWGRLKSLAKISEDAEGGAFALLITFGILADAIYILLNYEMNKYGVTGADEILFIWSILCGLGIWIAGGMERWLVKLVLPVILFFLVAEVADTAYLEHWVDFELAPLVCLGISVIFVLKRWKKGMASLFKGSRIRKMKKYYEKTVRPIGAQLKREVHENWVHRIGEENMIKLNDID